MFEKAARMKLRFDYKGSCSVEDLWDLNVRALDSIFKTLNTELKDQKGESLLGGKSRITEVLELKIAIIKHIVEVKLSEISKKEDAAMRKEYKQKLLKIREEKQDQSLKEMPLEELDKLIAAEE